MSTLISYQVSGIKKTTTSVSITKQVKTVQHSLGTISSLDIIAPVNTNSLMTASTFTKLIMLQKVRSLKVVFYARQLIIDEVECSRHIEPINECFRNSRHGQRIQSNAIR